MGVFLSQFPRPAKLGAGGVRARVLTCTVSKRRRDREGVGHGPRCGVPRPPVSPTSPAGSAGFFHQNGPRTRAPRPEPFRLSLLPSSSSAQLGCAVVEFKMEESMKKAAEVLNKHSLSGRPLKVKEDPDGEHARRAMQKVMATTGGMGMGPGGPGMINIPPSILNNPNIPNEIIHALQAGRLGSTVFVANLDYKVGWKKLKEVFSMAGVVVRADILEDKDGKSRGIGTVTFEQSIEAVQAISMFNGQLLFDRPMHVKMDERALPKGDFFPPERPQQLPHGLGGIGMGLGPGGQPIDANHLNKGIGMGNLGPAGMGMEGIGFGINKIGGMEGPFGGGMENMGRFGSGMNMGRINVDVDIEASSFPGGALLPFLLPFDFTWKMLKDKFNECGHVLYADIKMENGKSKGCGVVKFESPEVAERACRMMNGMKLSGREIDVRIDRNA
ncbi:hypothetical protein NN561_000690 [Cricetulus griseus]